MLKIMAMKKFVQKVLYRLLSLEGYLRVMSRGYFVAYSLGLLRGDGFIYVRNLKKLVRRGDSVIDIGANLGYFARPLSRIVGEQGQVYCVEPVAPIRNVLSRNLRNATNVTIYPYALGEKNGSVKMGNDTVGANDYMSTGQNYVMDENNRNEANVESASLEFDVELRRGSELFSALQRLDFIKCDIEGYEVVVLEEMRPVIERFTPTLLVETSGEKRARLTDYLHSLEYGDYILEESGLRPATESDTRDVLFVHKTKQLPL